MSRQDAMWVVIRGFGLFMLYQALLALFSFAWHGVTAIRYRGSTPEPYRTDNDSLFDEIFYQPDLWMPLIYAGAQLICFGLLARYLLVFGDMVHGWCTAAWKPDAGDGVGSQ